MGVMKMLTALLALSTLQSVCMGDSRAVLSIGQVSDANNWKCVTPTKIQNVTFPPDTPASKFTSGDCLYMDAKDEAIYSKFVAAKKNMTFALPKALLAPNGGTFPAGSYGSFIADPTGCKQSNYGLRLLGTTFAATDSSTQTKPPITCPVGQVYVLRTPSTPENACTTKYGDENNRWEQDGLLCYPVCRDGFYGVGPVCWSRCPSGTTDGGVFCTKSTYAPHTRVTFYGCHSNEFRYGMECITDCKDGYSKYWAVAMYYCGAKCGPNTVDAGLTCTKTSYGRTAGKLAVSVNEFVAVVLGSIAGAVVVAAGAVATGGAAAPELIAAFAAAEEAGTTLVWADEIGGALEEVYVFDASAPIVPVPP